MWRVYCFLAAAVLWVTLRLAGSTPWWTTAHVYQVYTRSFKDTDGDGIGDLRGITSSAEYFKEIGVDAIWLSPINRSPMVDFGYDVADYTEIDPVYGSMEDFCDLKRKLDELGVKLMMDFVPNHTSDQHPWFQSSQNTSDPLHSIYRDFYVWRDPKEWVNGNPIPPNNWFSIFSGSAWKWSEDRRQFYLHQFNVQQPDLNYRNPEVVSNMTAVLGFWMDKGVDGFRIDAVPWIFEDANFTDDPLVAGAKYPSGIDQLRHVYERNQPETFTLLQNWGDFVIHRNLQDDRDRFIFLEIYESLQVTMKYYGTGKRSLELPFNFLLMLMKRPSASYDIKELINLWINSMPKHGVPNWVIGNHDQSRVATKFGIEMVDIMNLLTMILTGVKVTYYGEEIGMTNTFVPPDLRVDKSIFSRDAFRTPMQWSDSPSAGFSTNSTTWLPVNPNYLALNVDAQRSAQSSHLKVFQAMAQARKDPVLQIGDLQIMTPDGNTLIVVRTLNHSNYLLLVNLGEKVISYSSKSVFFRNTLDQNYTVVVGSVNSGYTPGTTVKQGLMSISLASRSALLLRYSTTSSAIGYALPMFLLVPALVFTMIV